MKGREGRSGGDGGRTERSCEPVIVFEDAATESPMGESPRRRSEAPTLCPQPCVCGRSVRLHACLYVEHL